VGDRTRRFLMTGFRLVWASSLFAGILLAVFIIIEDD